MTRQRMAWPRSMAELLIVVSLLAATLPLLSCSSDDAPAVPIDLPSFEGGPVVVDPGPNPPAQFIRKVLFLAIDGLRASKLDNTDGATLDIPNFDEAADPYR